MTELFVPGLVVRQQSGFYTVQCADQQITCSLRGRFKLEKTNEDFAAVGDRVQVEIQSEGKGVIEAVLPRKSAFVRLAPMARGEYKQVLLANPDLLLIVFACAEPEPHTRMLDRFLVIAEKQRIPAAIVANKLDLISDAQAEAIFGMYRPLGYSVLFASAQTGQGVPEILDLLKGKITALGGPSGVGKSSLLNAMQPGLGIKVSHVKERDLKGRHTTVARELYPLDGGGYVADLPGLRMLSLWDTEPEELDGYFPELRPLVEHCQFNDCSHSHEPGCAVIAAVEEGKVDARRYDSYLRLRAGEPG